MTQNSRTWASYLELPPSAGRKEAVQWLLMGRLALLFSMLTLVVISQVFRRGSVSNEELFLSYLFLGGAFGFTLLSAISLDLFMRFRWAAAVQVVFDTAITSLWIWWGSSDERLFALVYLLQILAVALTFYQKGAVLTSVLASVLYGLVLNYGPVSEENPLLTWSVCSLIFISLGVVGGYLSEELARTTRHLQERNRQFDLLTELYQRIISGMPTGLLTIDRDMRIQFMNPGAEQILNRLSRDVVGKTLAEIEPDLIPFFTQIQSTPIADEEMESPVGGMPTELEATGTDLHRTAFLTPRSQRGQVRIQQTVEIGRGRSQRILRGDVADIEVGAGVGKLLGQGVESGRVLLFQDVTKLVHLEGKLKQHEKLAAVGQLAAGIAHEIRNPLASMSASIQMLKNSIPVGTLGDEDQRLMEIVIREIDRLNDLISEFLDFVKPENIRLEAVDLGKLLSEILVAARNQRDFSQKVEWAENLSPETIAFASPEKLKAVVWNLVTNAAQAMKRSGRLEVGCRVVGPHAVMFWVQDEGEGMSEEVKQHLYEPFFTTKPKGTGLGLATAYKIIEAHQGEIRVQSTVGFGTRFEVTLQRG